MKKVYTLFATICFTVNLLAQVPKQMNYQGVARDANNQPLVNRNISLRLNILDNSALGSVVYQEVFLGISTNAMGLFTVKIGTGTPTSSTFDAVNWSTNTKWLKTEINVNGGSTNFVEAGVPTQLVSVPYALLAEKVASGGIVTIDATNYQTVNFSPINQIVLVSQNITVAADYSKLRGERMTVIGGYFTGTGTQKISFGGVGSYSNCQSTKFRNLAIIGGNFYDCYFENCTFEGGTFTNCAMNGTGSAIIMTNCDATNCNLTVQNGLYNSRINGSNITTSYLENNYISSSTTNLTSNGLCHNNRFSFSLLQCTAGSSVRISNNEFAAPLSGETSIMKINLTDNVVFMKVMINNNTINSNGASNKGISLIGTTTTFGGMVKISGNLITNGTLIDYLSPTRVLISDNFYQGTLIANSQVTSQVTVQNNYSN